MQFAFGLQRFGGIEYIPRVVGLGVARIDGAGATAMATCCLMTGFLHRRPEAASLRGLARLKAAAVVALCAPVLYVPMLALIFTGATLFGRLAYGLPPHAFFDALTGEDYRQGALYALLFALLPAAWFLFGRKIWAAERGLAFKFVALYLVRLAIYAGAALVAFVIT